MAVVDAGGDATLDWCVDHRACGGIRNSAAALVFVVTGRVGVALRSVGALLPAWGTTRHRRLDGGTNGISPRVLATVGVNVETRFLGIARSGIRAAIGTACPWIARFLRAVLGGLRTLRMRRGALIRRVTGKLGDAEIGVRTLLLPAD